MYREITDELIKWKDSKRTTRHYERRSMEINQTEDELNKIFF